jgi:ribosomal-protein-alanine N-acetyltransferase
MSDIKVLRRGTAVHLRALDGADAPICAAWFNDAALTGHMNKGAFPNTLAQQVEHLEKMQRSRSDVQLGIVLAESGTLVGTVGIHKIDATHRHGDISIVIGDPAAHGKGVATEAIALMTAHAFEKLNLHKVTAGMWATNAGSRKAFEKNGFVLEGTLRESFWQGDRWVDEIRLGLLRADWLSTRDGGSAG